MSNDINIEDVNYTVEINEQNTFEIKLNEQGPQGDRGIQGEQGIQGETGNGIVDITKTSTQGNIDTYTITYTNGSHDEIDVTNAIDYSFGDGIVNNNNTLSVQDYNRIIKNNNSPNEVGKSISIGYDSSGDSYNSSVSVGLETKSANYGVAIGSVATQSGFGGIAIGNNSISGGNQTYDTIAIGRGARATANGAIQIGLGTNNDANTLSIGLADYGNVKLLNSNGKIPDARLSSNVAMISDLDSKQDVINATNKILSDFVDDTNQVNKFATTLQLSQISTNQSDIATINNKIPEQASSSNKLADKNFVNSSIATNTANFIGTFSDVLSLNAYSGNVTNNDYAFVVNSVITNSGQDWSSLSLLNDYPDSWLTNFDYAWVINGSNFDLYRYDKINEEWILRISDTPKEGVTLNTAYNRYKATVFNNIASWEWEYTLNNSSFTASQWASINSGITSNLVTQIGTNQNNIDTINSTISGYGNIVTHDVNEFATASQGTKADTAVQPSDLATVATTGDYYDLINKPTIPNVNNNTITIQKNGTTVDSFTINQSSDETINITVPTDTSDLSNNAGYITGIDSNDVTTALGYTPYNSSNPSGYTSNTGTVTSVNNVSPINGNVTLSIPSTTYMCTTNTQQDITARKTFVGEKTIYFKQSSSSNKLGFTLYNNSNNEVGGLEYNPSNNILALNAPKTGNTLLGFRYWGINNIIVPKPSGSGDYYIPLSFKNGSKTAVTNNSGIADLSNLFPTIATSVSSSSTNAETVGAKLFYDTVGDIETLLQGV